VFVSTVDGQYGRIICRPAIENDSMRRRGFGGFQRLRGTDVYKYQACPLMPAINLKARTAARRVSRHILVDGNFVAKNP